MVISNVYYYYECIFSNDLCIFACIYFAVNNSHLCLLSHFTLPLLLCLPLYFTSLRASSTKPSFSVTLPNFHVHFRHLFFSPSFSNFSYILDHFTFDFSSMYSFFSLALIISKIFYFHEEYLIECAHGCETFINIGRLQVSFWCECEWTHPSRQPAVMIQCHFGASWFPNND